MNRIISLLLAIGLSLWSIFAQAPSTPQKPQQEPAPDDVVRISTELVQADAVVTDKNDQVVTDLKLEDFEVYENGKKQDLKFVELITIQKATAGAPDRTVATGIDTSLTRELTAKDVRRVIAFVVDDVTIPSEDMSRVRQLLSDFVENKMQEGDLVAIVRTVGGKGLLEQFTPDRQILRRAISQLGVRTVPPHLAFQCRRFRTYSSTVTFG